VTEFRYAAVGDLSNDKVKCCKICAENGWPRELIDFVKVNGKMRSDGTYEAAYWQLKITTQASRMSISSNNNRNSSTWVGTWRYLNNKNGYYCQI
jgi:hypothetical protein